jgi:hypothetical protein
MRLAMRRSDLPAKVAVSLRSKPLQRGRPLPRLTRRWPASKASAPCVFRILGARPEFLLYSGLVEYARNDFSGAMGRLSAATQLSEAPVEPMATFFFGRAALGADEKDRAKSAFQRVVDDFPGTQYFLDDNNREQHETGVRVSL